MKKIIGLLFILLFLTSCVNNIYSDKEIASIEYSTTTCFIPNRTEKKIDLINNVVLVRDYIVDVEYVDYDIQYAFSNEKEEEFIKNIIKHGIYRMKESYREEGVYDADSWDLVIEFTDGEQLRSHGYATYPNVLKKIDNDCIKLFGDYLTNIKNPLITPPRLLTKLTYKSENVDLYYNTVIRPTNYTWDNKSINDKNNVEFIKGCNRVISDLYFSDSNIDLNTVKLIINIPYKEYKYSMITIYNYDLDGLNEIFILETIDNVINLEIEFNKMYIIKIDYEKGTSYYPFSTNLNRSEKI